ncbi:hypothetical protein [Paenibacillus foliorum]|nr:hypothetical protein [Paenibacillus foliorum]
MKWKQELLFIKRDTNGVIVAISEKTPEGYMVETNEEIEAEEQS